MILTLARASCSCRMSLSLASSDCLRSAMSLTMPHMPVDCPSLSFIVRAINVVREAWRKG